MPAVREPFSIVVVTWNSKAVLPGLIESINAHLTSPHELLFVDNASTDNSVELIRELAPTARLLDLDTNTDFSGGNNIGVRAASHDVVVLLNADTLLLDDSLADLAGLARETGAICGPRLLYEDGTPQVSAHPPVAGWESLVSAVWPGQLMPAALAARCDPWRADRRVDAGWVSAACFAARKDLLVELGPFDEFFPFHGDDIDLGVRARKRGVRNVFAPDVARVVHIGGKSVEQRWDDWGVTNAMRMRSQVVRRNFPAWRARFDDAVQLLTFGSRWAIKAIARRPDAGRDRAYVTAILRRGRQE